MKPQSPCATANNCRVQPYPNPRPSPVQKRQHPYPQGRTPVGLRGQCVGWPQPPAPPLGHYAIVGRQLSPPGTTVGVLTGIPSGRSHADGGLRPTRAFRMLSCVGVHDGPFPKPPRPEHGCTMMPLSPSPAHALPYLLPSLILSLSHSLILLLSHSLTRSQPHTLSVTLSLSHPLATPHTLSHSLTLSLSHPLTLSLPPSPRSSAPCSLSLRVSFVMGSIGIFRCNMMFLRADPELHSPWQVPNKTYVLSQATKASVLDLQGRHWTRVLSILQSVDSSTASPIPTDSVPPPADGTLEPVSTAGLCPLTRPVPNDLSSRASALPPLVPHPTQCALAYHPFPYSTAPAFSVLAPAHCAKYPNARPEVTRCGVCRFRRAALASLSLAHALPYLPLSLSHSLPHSLSPFLQPSLAPFPLCSRLFWAQSAFFTRDRTSIFSCKQRSLAPQGAPRPRNCLRAHSIRHSSRNSEVGWPFP